LKGKILLCISLFFVSVNLSATNNYYSTKHKNNKKCNTYGGIETDPHAAGKNMHHDKKSCKLKKLYKHKKHYEDKKYYKYKK